MWVRHCRRVELKVERPELRRVLRCTSCSTWLTAVVRTPQRGQPHLVLGGLQDVCQVGGRKRPGTQGCPAGSQNPTPGNWESGLYEKLGFGSLTSKCSSWSRGAWLYVPSRVEQREDPSAELWGENEQSPRRPSTSTLRSGRRGGVGREPAVGRL